MRFLADHFRRFGWLYSALAVALAWPSIIGTLRAPPELDVETLRQATAYQDQLLAEFSGSPAFEEFRELWTEDQLNIAFAKDPRIRRLINGVAGVAGSPWVTELDDIESTYGEVLNKWASLDGKASYAKPGGEYLARYESEDLQGYLNLVYEEEVYLGYVFFHGRSAWHRALAVRAIGQEDWDEALRQGQLSLGVWRPGYAIKVLQRVNFVSAAVDIYLDFLAARPPREVQQRCINELANLLDEVAALPKMPITPATAQLPQAHKPFGLGLFLVGRSSEAFTRLLTYRDQFGHPALINWAKRHSYQGEYLYSMRRDLNWTSAMVEVRVLRLAAEHEPYVLEAHNLPADLQSRLDPFTLACTLPYDVFSASSEYRKSESIDRTRLLLLQAAFASQMYRMEYGNWPSGPEQLYTDGLLPELEGMTLPPHMEWKFDTAIAPVLPIRMGWLELDEASFQAHWRGWLHETSPGTCGEVGRHGSGEHFKIHLGHESEAEPVRALALAAFLNARMPSVQSAEILCRLPGKKDSRASVLATGFAREMTDRSDRLAISSLAHTHEAFRQAARLDGEDLRHFTGGAPGTMGLLQDVELQIHLDPPERVFAIWSPGPDGIDDGARMPYRSQDHQGNPVHRGDIVLFPEGL